MKCPTLLFPVCLFAIGAAAHATPIINSFTPSSSTIAAGSSVTLTWSTTGATSATLTNHSSVAVNGSATEYPAVTTTYSLTATDSTGSSHATVTVTVTPTTPIATLSLTPGTTSALSAKLLGLSLVLDETPYMMGKSPTNMNPIFAKLVGNLTKYGNSPMVIRELHDEPVYSGFSGYLSTIGQFSTSTGVRYFVGVDMRDNTPATAASEAASIAAAIPAGNLVGYELGNEPDLYVSTGYRPAATWAFSSTDPSVDTYMKEYPAFASAIAGASSIKPAAPVFSGGNPTETGWLDSKLTGFITSEASTLSMVNLHHYPGDHCGTDTVATDFLLSSYALTGGPTSPANIYPYVSAASGAGLYNVRIGELNSVACGGQSGVSDGFQSALWAMDIMFAYGHAGVTGVNFFTVRQEDGSSYSPFDFNTTVGTTNSWTVHKINPMYYGLLMGAQAMQKESSFVSQTLTTSDRISAWSMKDNTGVIRVLLINKDESHSGTVSISLAGYGNGNLSRLMAPTMNSNTGVTLAGQTFDGSTDGSIQGATWSETILPSSGTYTVTLPKVSAALLVIGQ